jgi:hypothetical protein
MQKSTVSTFVVGVGKQFMGIVAIRCLQVIGLGMLVSGATVCFAAPTTDLDGTASGVVTQNELISPGRARTQSGEGLGLSDRPLETEGSTGNRQLDLLLERSDRADKPATAPARQSSAASAAAAAAALAALRAKAAAPAPQETVVAKPAVQPLQQSTVLGSTEPGPGEPVKRREWTGRPGGSTGLGIGERSVADAGEHERDRSDDDNVLRLLPRELSEFLRVNRYWLLGGLGLLAAVGIAVKGFSRRI